MFSAINKTLCAALLVGLAACGNADREGAVALLDESRSAVSSRNFVKAIELLDTINSRYRGQTEIRREALAVRAEAMEGIAMDSISAGDQALAEAQANGYAEKDPTADVDGHDACRKICILSDLAFGDKFDPEAVSCEGISRITLRDVECADRLGCVIKLIGRAVRCADGTAYAFVAPHLVPKESPLAAVEDVFNAIMVEGNATGDVMFYGKGAGKLATASAVCADMLDCIAHREHRRRISWGDGSQKLLRPLDTFVSPWYVRYQGPRAALEAALPCESVREVGGELAASVSALSTADLKARIAKLEGHVISNMRML